MSLTLNALKKLQRNGAFPAPAPRVADTSGLPAAEILDYLPPFVQCDTEVNHVQLEPIALLETALQTIDSEVCEVEDASGVDDGPSSHGIEIVEPPVSNVAANTVTPQIDKPAPVDTPLGSPHADASQVDGTQADINAVTMTPPQEDSACADQLAAEALIPEAQLAEANPAEAPPADTPYADTPPADTPYADTPYADTPHADIAQADITQAEATQAEAQLPIEPALLPASEMTLDLAKFQPTEPIPYWDQLTESCAATESEPHEADTLSSVAEFASNYDPVIQSLDVDDLDAPASIAFEDSVNGRVSEGSFGEAEPEAEPEAELDAELEFAVEIDAEADAGEDADAPAVDWRQLNTTQALLAKAVLAYEQIQVAELVEATPELEGQGETAEQLAAATAAAASSHGVANAAALPEYAENATENVSGWHLSLPTSFETDVIATLDDDDLSEPYRSLLDEVRLRNNFVLPPGLMFCSTQMTARSGGVLAHLATLLAAQGEDILIVDANLAEQTLTRSYEALGTPGLCDILAGSTSPLDVLRVTARPHLFFLPCGDDVLGISRDAGQLSVQRLTSSLAIWKQHFHRILVDVGDINSTLFAPYSQCLEAMMLVVPSPCPSVTTIQQARKQLKDATAKLLGLVLTDWSRKQ